MKNLLAPGAGGLPSASPEDSRVNKMVPPQPQISPMMQEFGGQLDAAANRFEKVKQAQGQVRATRQGLDKLLALRDTVSTEDVVAAAAGMVAAGIPALEVASILADMPGPGPQLEAWLQQKSQEVAQTEALVAEALEQSRYDLGIAAMGNLIAAGAEMNDMRSRAVPGTGSVN